MNKNLKKKLLIASVIFLSFNIIPAKTSNASTFSDATYQAASEYNEMETRIVSESSEQALEFFQMITRWEVYNASEQEENDDIKEYIEKAKERYSFVNNYDSNLAKEVRYCYTSYLNLLEQLRKEGVVKFVNGYPIFIDFLENNISETQKNFLSFKKDGLTKFLDTFIYTNNNKIAVNKVMNGTSAEKNEGIQTLNMTIAGLTDVETKTIQQKNDKGEIINVYASPDIIRKYATAYKTYYQQVVSGNFKGSANLLLHEKYRVDGLIPVGSVFDEISEFYVYKDVFNSFTDYPSIEIAIKLKSSKIEKTVNTLNKQDMKTANVQKLKQLHYEFLYQLSEYKKTNDIGAVTKAYNNFYNHYAFLKSYYTRVSKRFGNFSSSTTVQEISKLKELAKCIDPNFAPINELVYTSSYTQDTNSYREFLVGKDFNEYLKIGFIVFPASIVVIFLIVVFSNIKKQKNNNNYNDYDDYDDNDYNW